MIIWYNNSFLASLISIIGSVMVILGVTEAIQGEPSALVVVIPGVAGVLLGKWISSRKAKKAAHRSAPSPEPETRSATSPAPDTWSATSPAPDTWSAPKPASDTWSAPNPAPDAWSAPKPSTGTKSGSKLSGDLWNTPSSLD